MLIKIEPTQTYFLNVNKWSLCVWQTCENIRVADKLGHVLIYSALHTSTWLRE